MRELVEITFEDLSNYTNNQSDDILATAFNHQWGPVNQLVRLNFTDFLAYYPALQASDSYRRAYSAMVNGVQTIEVIRPQGTYEYLNITLGNDAIVGTPSTDATKFVAGTPGQGKTAVAVLALKYPGNPVDFDTALYTSVLVEWTVSAEGVDVEGPSLAITTTAIDSNAVETVLEIIEGSPVMGHSTDGKLDYLGDKIADSKYWDLKILTDLTDITVGDDYSIVAFDTYDEDKVSDENFVTALENAFKSDEGSRASLIIGPYEESTVTAEVISIADYRNDIVALVGYPVTETFAKADILSYAAALSSSMFAIFTAGRCFETLQGVRKETDGIGILAGLYAKVAKSAGINQVPSANSYGAFPAPLSETLNMAAVVDLHANNKVCSIYSSVSGPQVFGVRDLHSRQNSYFAKSNISRVNSFIIKTTLTLVGAIMHTPNTVQKQLSVEMNRQAYLDRLIGQQALKPGSVAICNATNNTDLASNGGEILILDFVLYYVKLIEAVRIKITASDSTTTVNIS